MRLARQALLCWCALALFAGCVQIRPPEAPFDVVSSPAQIAHFKPLPRSAGLVSDPWRVEANLGDRFGREVCWQEALFCYRRAHILAPAGPEAQALAYNSVLCHFLAGKPSDVIDAFLRSELPSVDPTFPAFGDLLVALGDSYIRRATGGDSDAREGARTALKLLAERDERRAALVSLRGLIAARDARALEALSSRDPALEHIRPLMREYRRRALNPNRALTLNALLPGAGYWYVGQRQTALTSLALNALFGAAAWRAFHRGDTALGLIALTFEFGWYFGGMQGAKLAAESFNRRQFDLIGAKILREGGARSAQLIEFGF